MNPLTPADAAVLVVPSERLRPGDEQARLVLRRLDSGEVVVPAYTSVGALVAACGPDQPWVALPPAALDALVAAGTAATVVLDTAFTTSPDEGAAP